MHSSPLKRHKRSQNQEIIVPNGPDSLFWSIVISYLVPIKDVRTTLLSTEERINTRPELFYIRCKKLLYNGLEGNELEQFLEKVRISLSEGKINRGIYDLVDGLRTRVIHHISEKRSTFSAYILNEYGLPLNKYMANILDRTIWPGEAEIRAISDLLGCHIRVFRVADKNDPDKTYGNPSSYSIDLYTPSSTSSIYRSYGPILELGPSMNIDYITLLEKSLTELYSVTGPYHLNELTESMIMESYLGENNQFSLKRGIQQIVNEVSIAYPLHRADSFFTHMFFGNIILLKNTESGKYLESKLGPLSISIKFGDHSNRVFKIVVIRGDIASTQDLIDKVRIFIISEGIGYEHAWKNRDVYDSNFYNFELKEVLGESYVQMDVQSVIDKIKVTHIGIKRDETKTLTVDIIKTQVNSLYDIRRVRKPKLFIAVEQRDFDNPEQYIRMMSSSSPDEVGRAYITFVENLNSLIRQFNITPARRLLTNYRAVEIDTAIFIGSLTNFYRNYKLEIYPTKFLESRTKRFSDLKHSSIALLFRGYGFNYHSVPIITTIGQQEFDEFGSSLDDLFDQSFAIKQAILGPITMSENAVVTSISLSFDSNDNLDYEYSVKGIEAKSIYDYRNLLGDDAFLMFLHPPQPDLNIRNNEITTPEYMKSFILGAMLFGDSEIPESAIEKRILVDNDKIMAFIFSRKEIPLHNSPHGTTVNSIFIMKTEHSVMRYFIPLDRIFHFSRNDRFNILESNILYVRDVIPSIKEYRSYTYYENTKRAALMTEAPGTFITIEKNTDLKQAIDHFMSNNKENSFDSFLPISKKVSELIKKYNLLDFIPDASNLNALFQGIFNTYSVSGMYSGENIVIVTDKLIVSKARLPNAEGKHPKLPKTIVKASHMLLVSIKNTYSRRDYHDPGFYNQFAHNPKILRFQMQTGNKALNEELVMTSPSIRSIMGASVKAEFLTINFDRDEVQTNDLIYCADAKMIDTVKNSCAKKLRVQRSLQISCVDSNDDVKVVKSRKEIAELLDTKVIEQITNSDLMLGVVKDPEVKSKLSSRIEILNSVYQSLALAHTQGLNEKVTKKSYYSVLMNIGALLYDHNNHIPSSGQSSLDKRIHSSQLLTKAKELYYSRTAEDVSKHHIDVKEVKPLLSRSSTTALKEEFEAYIKEVITIRPEQIFNDGIDIKVRVADSALVIGSTNDLLNTENYTLDEETSEIKLKLGDEEYTLVAELKEKEGDLHTRHYLTLSGGYTVKLSHLIANFGQNEIRQAIYDKLTTLELLDQKLHIEKIADITISDHDYENARSEVKGALIEKGVSSEHAEKLISNIESSTSEVSTKYVNDIESDLVKNGIEVSNDKFELAKANGVRGGKWFSLMAIYDLIDSIRDVSTIGRHDDNALKQVFGLNGILDSINDVRQSLSTAYLQGSTIKTKFSPDSTIGKITSKVPSPVRKYFVKFIDNPAVRGLVFVTVAYQFGHSAEEIAKGNHNPLNYYWLGSSGIKLGGMGIGYVSAGASFVMGGLSSSVIRAVSFTSRILGKLSIVTAVLDVVISIFADIYQSVVYTDKVAESIPLSLEEKAAIGFDHSFWGFLKPGEKDKEAEDTIRVKRYLTAMKEVAVNQLVCNEQLIAVLQSIETIKEIYNERQYNKTIINTPSVELLILSSLDVHNTLPLVPWNLNNTEVYLDKDRKHIPHINKAEYCDGLRIVTAPKGYKYSEGYGEVCLERCIIGQNQKTYEKTFTFSPLQPLLFSNITRQMGSILYSAVPNRFTAAPNYPAVINVPKGQVEQTGTEVTFVVNHYSSGKLKGEVGKQNTLVLNIDKNIENTVADLRSGSVSYGPSELTLENVYNLIANVTGNASISTDCKTRYINVNANENSDIVNDQNNNCANTDSEIREVNRNNVHFRGLKQTTFIVGKHSNNAKILNNIVSNKNNVDIIKIQTEDRIPSSSCSTMKSDDSLKVEDLKLEKNKNGYTLLLLKSTNPISKALSFLRIKENVIASIEIDSFTNLEIEKNGKRYIANIDTMELDPVLELPQEDTVYNGPPIKLYNSDEQGLQIYRDDEENIGFIDLRDKSILNCTMNIIDNRLVLLHKDIPFVKIENWKTNPSARSVIFAFKELQLSYLDCIFNNCDNKSIIEKYLDSLHEVLKSNYRSKNINKPFRSASTSHVVQRQLYPNLYPNYSKVDDEQSSWTSYHYAAALGEEYVVKSLIDNSIAISKDSNGIHPIHLAAFYGHSEIFDILNSAIFYSENNDALRIIDDNLMTPLHVAASKGYLELVKHMLDLGADPYAVSNIGETPLDLARARGETNIVSYLESLKRNRRSIESSQMDKHSVEENKKGSTEELSYSQLDNEKTTIRKAIDSKSTTHNNTLGTGNFDFNGALLLSTLLSKLPIVGKFLPKMKLPDTNSTTFTSVSLPESMAYAAEITQEFEKMLNKIATHLNISKESLDLAPVSLISKIAQLFRNGSKPSELSKVLYSHAREIGIDSNEFLNLIKAELPNLEKTYESKFNNPQINITSFPINNTVPSNITTPNKKEIKYLPSSSMSNVNTLAVVNNSVMR